MYAYVPVVSEEAMSSVSWWFYYSNTVSYFLFQFDFPKLQYTANFLSLIASVESIS